MSAVGSSDHSNELFLHFKIPVQQAIYGSDDHFMKRLESEQGAHKVDSLLHISLEIGAHKSRELCSESTKTHLHVYTKAKHKVGLIRKMSQDLRLFTPKTNTTWGITSCPVSIRWPLWRSAVIHLPANLPSALF